MPNNVDFSKVENIQRIEVNPDGWVNPLYIECGTSEEMYPIPSYYWRVEGTKHTFTIPIIRMDFISKGDHKKHFEDVLEIFKEDYISWKEKGYNTDWFNEYRQQYKSFILV